MKKLLRNSGTPILFIIIFFSGGLFAQDKQSAKALLWKVSGNGLRESSYLFGTYHLLGNKFLAEVPETDKPFKDAKGIVVETEIDSSKLMSIMMKSIMPEKRISNMMSAEDYKLVSEEFHRLTNTNLAQVDMLKPAHVNAVISMLSAQENNRAVLDKYASVPLDIYFANEGKRLGKTVTPLESMEQQFTILFDHATEEEQARQLAETVRQKELMQKSSVDLTNFYVTRDLPGLLTLMESYPKEVTGELDYMLKDRNEKWVMVLPDLMKSGSQFIAVGAGHLPGEYGVISLLRKLGYTVTPVTK
jgi:uncharacterized protein YbaP (TraB family)